MSVRVQLTMELETQPVLHVQKILLGASLDLIVALLQLLTQQLGIECVLIMDVEDLDFMLIYHLILVCHARRGVKIEKFLQINALNVGTFLFQIYLTGQLSNVSVLVLKVDFMIQ